MSRSRTIGAGKLKRARSRPAVKEFPAPLFAEWDDPSVFCEALALQMRRFGDTDARLRCAVIAPGDICDRTTIRSWRLGVKEPRSAASYELLERVEDRYRLPRGYFRRKLSHQVRASTGIAVKGVAPAERRRLMWHLPDDFDRRSFKDQQEILTWVRRVIISGSTEYRQYQAIALRDRYSLRFGLPRGRRPSRQYPEAEEFSMPEEPDPELQSGSLRAPRALRDELDALLQFKTATLTETGFLRSGVWGEETAAQKAEHFGLVFGAMAASPSSRIKGLGVPRNHLTFALLVMPAVWDWYVQWRERRRGFYTRWEVDMLRVGLALTRREYGWLRQSPHLAGCLRPIPGIITADEVGAAQMDWDAACDRMHVHGLTRAKEIGRVARVHRDPFEPILPILEAPSPLAAYRGITEEILQRIPDERRHPLAAAEAVRAFLMLRLGLHLGVRQKNLRQLLFKRRGDAPTNERVLETAKRGELRWNDREGGWEVLIPSVAFKNAASSYFGQKPFRLVLPDIAPLYRLIDDYIARYRSRLLRGADDPGTFFVKTVKTTSRDAAYCQTSFYEAWRLTIARYGVYNPYTGRGVVKGLLPHGPHNLRDVLATHILKQTGSYEQASYAIQDTPDTVAQHYGRFLPQDKAALAAQILNKTWQTPAR